MIIRNHLSRKVIFLCLTFALSASVSAQLTTNRDGKLDRSFGTNGLTRFSVEKDFGTIEYLPEIARTPDGKLLILHSLRHNGSDFRVLLTRFLSDGTPDTEFGTNGKLLLSSWPSFTSTNVVAEPDGKMVLTGLDWNGVDFMVLRILANGQPDPTFGVNGVIRKDFSLSGGQSNDLAFSTIRQPDGKYVVSGTSDRFNFGQTSTFVSVVGLNSDGSIDKTYASGGMSILVGQGHSANIIPNKVGTSFRLSDGRLLIGTIKDRLVPNGEGQVRHYINLLRLLPNGDLDATFSDDGIVEFVEIFPAPFVGLKVSENDKIAVATGYEVKRFLSNGTIDATFSHVPFPMQIYDLDVLENGKLLPVGLRFGPDGISGVVRRLHPDGGSDFKFGQYGVSEVRLDYESDTAILASVVDSSGNLIVLGENNATPTRTLFIARIFTSRKV